MLIEKAVIGWKEYELELLRDSADHVTVVCTVENLDPVGIHTGDSVTVAPAMTLPDTVYQDMRNQAKLMMKELGSFAGGCNIQFSVNPGNRGGLLNRDESEGCQGLQHWLQKLRDILLLRLLRS